MDTSDLELLARLLAVPLAMTIDPFAPLLVFGICLRVGLITDPGLLRPELAGFADPVFLTVVGALYVLHVLSDKLPPVAHAYDAIGVVAKPIAGAFVGLWMAGELAPGSALHWTAVALVVCGVLPMVLALQVARAKVRLAASAMSLGAIHPVVSTTESFVALPIAALSILRPEIALLLIALVVVPALCLAWLLIKLALRASRRIASPRRRAAPG
jgi:hypothetical protein